MQRLSVHMLGYSGPLLALERTPTRTSRRRLVLSCCKYTARETSRGEDGFLAKHRGKNETTLSRCGRANSGAPPWHLFTYQTRCKSAKEEHWKWDCSGPLQAQLEPSTQHSWARNDPLGITSIRQTRWDNLTGQRLWVRATLLGKYSAFGKASSYQSAGKGKGSNFFF